MGDIRTEMVEIPVNNAGVTSFSLGSLPNLRNAKNIVRVEAYGAALVPVAPSGADVVNTTVFNKSYLRLITVQDTEIRALPLQSISKSINGTTIPDLNTGAIDPEKSKIVIGSAAGIVLNQVFLLAVTYEK